MKKVIMTGATGFIGYYLLKELVEKQIDVWIVCRDKNPVLEKISVSAKIHIVKCNLENISMLPYICGERNFDVFFHLAWEGASGPERSAPDIQMKNALWTCNCIESAKKMSCAKIVITGTICEKQVDQIIAEKLYSPSSYYLISKKFAHEMADVLSNKTDIRLIWCQFYHPIGVFNKKNQLISGTIVKLLNHQRLQFGSALGLFDIIDVTDLAHSIFLMGEKNMIKNQYMIGSNNPNPLKYYLEKMRKLIDPEANVEYGSLKTVDLTMKREWFDASDFEMETGFKPKVDFIQSVLEMKAWLENETIYDEEKWSFL